MSERPGGPSRLPLAISVPHGGTECPPELEGRVGLSRQDLFDDGDAFTREIYDLDGVVEAYVSASIARAYVDLNRAPDDLPPRNPDGVIKSHTDHGVPIYVEGKSPDEECVRVLIDHYHRPYHEALKRLRDVEGVAVAIDCHSMEPFAPAISPDSEGGRRPTFCLSNGGGVTCSDTLMETMRDSLSDAFGIPLGEVLLNDPFQGGYIVRRHGLEGGFPWMQLEMNRSLYLREPWFDQATLTLREGRSQELREMLEAALLTFVERAGL